MATSPYRPSDHNTNLNQTDGHLHVGSGTETLKTEEQSLNNFDIKGILSELVMQQKITNLHLKQLTENNYNREDL